MQNVATSLISPVNKESLCAKLLEYYSSNIDMKSVNYFLC